MRYYDAETIQAARDSFVSWQTRYTQALKTIECYDTGSVMIGSANCHLCQICDSCYDCPVTHYDELCNSFDSPYTRFVESGLEVRRGLLTITAESLPEMRELVEHLRQVWLYARDPSLHTDREEEEYEED